MNSIVTKDFTDFLAAYDCNIEEIYEEFKKIPEYESIAANEGGMKAEGLLSLFILLRLIKPDAYIESGAWMGLSSCIARRALGDTPPMYVFEPNLAKVVYRVADASYTNLDFATPTYQSIGSDHKNLMIFFDDHQDCIERIYTSWLRGVQWILFDDDYRVRADHRTFANFIMLPENQKNSPCISLLKHMIEYVVVIVNPIHYVTGFIPRDQSQWRSQLLVKFYNNDNNIGWTAGKQHWCV